MFCGRGPETAGNESEVVHAKFALAADGARSWTRDALGVGADSEDTGSYHGHHFLSL
jgi:2-polyprenyl-6-methoxyphenol hydroxylase-like FAD-dependent oxidoreductase